MNNTPNDKLNTSVEQSLRKLSTDIRNLLQQEWKNKKCEKYGGQLTAIMSEEIFHIDTAKHKEHKSLSDNDDLRDNMSRKELSFLMLGELFAAYLLKYQTTEDYDKIKQHSLDGAKIARSVLKQFEEIADIKVLTSKNRIKK